MSTPGNPQREHPSTYFVQDRNNEEELTRVHIQDQMVTAAMGGALPEQPDPGHLQRILDSGCGTGGWLIEIARTYPTIPHLIGVDVSKSMVEYARAQATTAGVSKQVEFRSMDVLRMLEFTPGYFDLVNQRFCDSFLRTWDWSKVLSEYQRIVRTGGVIRITESDMAVESNSTALNRLNSLTVNAFYRAGHLFMPSGDGVRSELAQLLPRYGIQNVQTRDYILEYSANTTEGQHLYEDVAHLYRTIVPFLKKWSRVPDDYKMIYEQALSDMQQADFAASWHLMTAWGNKSTQRKSFISFP